MINNKPNEAGKQISPIEREIQELFGPKLKGALAARAVLWAKNDVDYSLVTGVHKASAKLVLYELAGMCNRYGKKNSPAYIAYPQNSTLAAGTHLAEGTLKKTLKALCRAQLIARITRKHKGMYQTTLTMLVLPGVNFDLWPGVNFDLWSTGQNCTILKGDNTQNGKDTQSIKVAGKPRNGKQDTPEKNESGRNEEGEIFSDEKKELRPIHSLYVSCNQLQGRTVVLTDKERGHLSQWADKVESVGLASFEVLEYIISQWDVFGSYARSDERVGYKVPAKPDPESLIECVNASIELWRDEND